MVSNLPPGVTESMIPGNRPEDEEVEILLTLGDIQILSDFAHNPALPDGVQNIINNILEQVDEEEEVVVEVQDD